MCVCVCVAVCDADDVAGNSKRLDGGPSTLSRFSLFFPLRFCTPTYANEPVRDCHPEKKKKLKEIFSDEIELNSERIGR